MISWVNPYIFSSVKYRSLELKLKLMLCILQIQMAPSTKLLCFNSFISNYFVSQFILQHIYRWPSCVTDLLLFIIFLGLKYFCYVLHMLRLFHCILHLFIPSWSLRFYSNKQLYKYPQTVGSYDLYGVFVLFAFYLFIFLLFEWMKIYI